MGPPPRAGRRQRVRPAHGPVTGTTPASGETTRQRPAGRRRTPDHPRERGDDPPEPRDASAAAGPPPRAGRRPGVDRRGPGTGGTTPASGETTRERQPERSRARDHPRERGDDGAVRAGRQHVGGPPPRAGRRRPQRDRPHPRHRTTPASGETTGGADALPPRPWDHPRERGDDSATWRCDAPEVGPPPRAGRRLQHRAPGVRVPGTTPASGETTLRGAARVVVAGDHPRERGDDRRSGDACRRLGGTTPASGETTWCGGW